MNPVFRWLTLPLPALLIAAAGPYDIWRTVHQGTSAFGEALLLLLVSGMVAHHVARLLTEAGNRMLYYLLTYMVCAILGVYLAARSYAVFGDADLEIVGVVIAYVAGVGFFPAGIGLAYWFREWRAKASG